MQKDLMVHDLLIGMSLLTIVILAYRGLIKFTFKILGFYILSLIILAYYGFISINTHRFQDLINQLVYIFSKILNVIINQLQKGG